MIKKETEGIIEHTIHHNLQHTCIENKRGDEVIISSNYQSNTVNIIQLDAVREQ